MGHSSFEDRLYRIERSQNRPITERMLAGVAEESLSHYARKSAAKKAKNASAMARPGPSKSIRFAAGFGLMFTSCLVMRHMNEIRAWLDGSADLAAYSTSAMAGLTAGLIAIALFFALKLQRAVFRVRYEPWRMTFALGMLLGFAAGFGTSDFAGEIMAKLQ